jgi:hypothetical protein
MAFLGRYSCFALTRVSVRQNAPALPGVYAISNSREWLFVGVAENVQSALYDHLAETDTQLRSLSPTGFTFQLCDARSRDTLYGRLMTDLHPVCKLPPSPAEKSNT